MQLYSKYLFILVCLLHTSTGVLANQPFKNEELLYGFFDKLYDLDTSRHGKINIVHIGDSHVQADFFTGTIREALQKRFGNGGYGFTFPYSLAKTNGTRSIRYKSNIQWLYSLNNGGSNIQKGLSVIGLQTTSKHFYIELETDNAYHFNTIKLLCLKGKSCFCQSLSNAKCCCTAEPIQWQAAQYHKVKKGETLYRISLNYGATVEAIKKANGLTSNIIEIGMQLHIPDGENEAENNCHPPAEDTIHGKGTSTTGEQRYVSVFKSIQPLSRIYILPDKQSPVYNLSGIVLENDMPGLVYHSIGVNSAKTSDFNKHPDFFDQLVVLNPNLIIISLGTNESFGHWASTDYLYHLNRMIRNIRARIPDAPVLLLSPPPSMLRRNRLNTFIEAYAKALLETEEYVVWDLFSEMGGLYAPRDKNYALLMAKDKIHYTKEGYRIQGERFSAGLLDAYAKYIKIKSN